MLDNFNSDNLSIRGDFRDADVTNNTIDCRQQRCLFGIQVGPRPWYPTRNIVGGHIWDNQIHGAEGGHQRRRWGRSASASPRYSATG